MNKNICKLVKNAALIFVLSLSTQTFAQQSNLLSSQEQIAESVKLAPCKSENRLAAVKQLFEKMGAKNEDITIEKFDKDKIANLVVKIKGKSEETIIVGAHYDKTKEGCGAIDNWTGISIIAHLYRTINRIQPEKSYLFVAFDQEEIGLLGSDAMAKAIPKEKRPQFCSMVNLDSFGFSAPQALENTSSSELVSIAKKLAKESDFPFTTGSILNADADSSSFRKRGIPAITFTALDKNWQKYLHSDGDKLEKINFNSVYLGYRFALAFLAKLDEISCAEIKK
jgi:Zn-dependent M28 family amino/carboxypeptidase